MKNIYILLLMVTALSVASCDQFVETIITDRITLANNDNKNLHFGGGGGSKSIVMKASTTWSAVSDKDWCWLTPAEGLASDIKLTVHVDDNRSEESRTAVVTITAGECSLVINVTQDERSTLSVEEADHVIQAEGGTFEVTLKHNVKYEVKIPKSVDWIEEVSSKAVSESVLVFQVLPNEEMEDRTAEITIVSEDEDLEEEITVLQYGIVPEKVQFSITHVKNSAFQIPAIWGSFSGTILWGDGNYDPFSKIASHNYSAAGEKVVTFELYGNPDDLIFSFTDIEGITELDLSGLSVD